MTKILERIQALVSDLCSSLVWCYLYSVSLTLNRSQIAPATLVDFYFVLSAFFRAFFT